MIKNDSSKNALTSLRFFAAVAVFVSHLSFLRNNNSPLRDIATTVLHESYIGVSFFFILSGYILSYCYQKRLITGDIRFGTFYLLRFARIFPLHIALALPLAAYYILTRGTSYIPIAVSNVLLVQSWIPVPEYYFSLNVPTWSLSVELFFYAVFPFLSQLRTRQLIQLSVTVLALNVGTAAYLKLSQQDQWVIDGQLQFSHWLSYVNPLYRLFEFVAGILIFRLSPTSKQAAHYGTRHELTAISLLCASLLVFSQSDFSNYLRASLLYLPAMVYLLVVFTSSKGKLTQSMCNSTLVLLGQASFAFYLIHRPVIQAVSEYFGPTTSAPRLMVMTLLAFGCSVILSVLLHLWIDQPVNRFIRQRVRN